MTIPDSRYNLANADLKRIALTLQVGEGISQRLDSVEGSQYIVEGELWAEAQSSAFVAVPLKPIPQPGTLTVPDPPTQYNYPNEFIMAALYWAAARMLFSEMSTLGANVSGVVEAAESRADWYIKQYRSRPTVHVGAGRRRNPNPHMPPNIAPQEDADQQNSFG